MTHLLIRVVIGGFAVIGLSVSVGFVLAAIRERSNHSARVSLRGVALDSPPQMSGR